MPHQLSFRLVLITSASLLLGRELQERPDASLARADSVVFASREHEVHALDADADGGVDDLAVRGRAPRTGGTVILRLDPNFQRLEWLADGFAWETS